MKRPRRGVGLVELLVSLAIAASLLTAVAVAVEASNKAYRINQEHSALMQRARLTINRIAAAIRTAREHQPISAAAQADFVGGRTTTDTGIELFDPQDREIAFRRDGETLYMDVDGASHKLAKGVEKFEVTFESMRSTRALRTGGGHDLLRRATILLTLKPTDDTALAGEGTGQTVTLSVSVMPRRNAW